MPDSTYRRNRLKYLCRFLLRLGMLKGEVIAPSDNIEGVSIWLPSTGSKNSNIDAIKAGLLNLFFQVNPKTISRFIKVGNIKGKKRATIVKGSYCLCDMIGVNPLYQKRGFGREMIGAKLLRFDKSETPCYLETSAKDNITYYNQFGFNVINEYQIHGVDTYCLLREPSQQD